MWIPLATHPGGDNPLGLLVGITLLFGLILLLPQSGGVGKRYLPRSLQSILVGHTELIFVGILLGPGVFGLINDTFIDQMRPFLTVGLGWLGLFFGIQWDWLKVKRFPRRQFLISGAQVLITFVVVFAAMVGVLMLDKAMGSRVVPGATWEDRVMMAALLGVVATPTAPIGISWLMKTRGARGANTDLSFFIAATDGVVSLVLFGLVLSAWQSESVIGIPALQAVANFSLSIAMGLVLGWMASFILMRRSSDPEYLLWLVGLIVLSSGAAHAVGQSPLLVNFFMGVVLVNLSHQSERVTRSLSGAEIPFYMLFLLLAGASCRFAVGWEWLLILIYVPIRLAGKVLGLRLGLQRWPLHFKPRGDLGMSLVCQGGLALTMIINVALLLPESPSVRVLVSLAIVAVAVNQMITPGLAERPLRLAGEISSG